MSWRDYADCARHRVDPTPPRVPHGSPAGKQAEATAAFARAYCAACPVLAECARDALAFGDVGVVRAGVWISSDRAYQSKAARDALQAVAGPGVIGDTRYRHDVDARHERIVELYDEGMPTRDIAKLVGRSPQAVREVRRRHRGLVRG